MTLNPLLLHELVHLAFTALAVCITSCLALNEKKKLRRELYLLAVLGAILGGFFIDTDHLIDYAFAYGFQLDLAKFFTGMMFDKLQKIHVFFHAWEWVVLLGVISLRIKNIKIKYFLIALMLGMLFHLILDSFSNHVYFFGYSILYRITHNFDISAMTPR